MVSTCIQGQREELREIKYIKDSTETQQEGQFYPCFHANETSKIQFG